MGSLLVIYRVMTDRVRHQELGDDFFEKLNGPQLTTYYHRKLEKAGYEASINLR